MMSYTSDLFFNVHGFYQVIWNDTQGTGVNTASLSMSDGRLYVIPQADFTSGTILRVQMTGVSYTKV